MSLEEARRVVQEFERSGLTRRGFAVERGMSVHTLDGYRLRLKRAAADRGRAARPRKPQWVEVEVPAAARGAEAAIVLRVGDGTEVLLQPGFDQEALRAVLDLLEGR